MIGWDAKVFLIFYYNIEIHFWITFSPIPFQKDLLKVSALVSFFSTGVVRVLVLVLAC